MAELINYHTTETTACTKAIAKACCVYSWQQNVTNLISSCPSSSESKTPIQPKQRQGLNMIFLKKRNCTLSCCFNGRGRNNHDKHKPGNENHHVTIL